MKRIAAALLIFGALLLSAALGAHQMYLYILRDAEFYVVGEMLIIDTELLNDYNEVDIDGGWDEFFDKHAKG